MKMYIKTFMAHAHFMDFEKHRERTKKSEQAERTCWERSVFKVIFKVPVIQKDLRKALISPFLKKISS
jgi:hypothetical protein